MVDLYWLGDPCELFGWIGFGLHNNRAQYAEIVWDSYIKFYGLMPRLGA